MIYQLTLQDVTYQDYPIPCPFAISSRVEEIDKNEAWNRLLSILIREKRLKGPFLYQALSLLEIDLSSVWPRYEIKNETSLIEEIVDISEEDIVTEMLEHDFIVRMPPRKRYTVEMKVENIRRGEPRIVEPEEF
ncbi:MAG: hypothetical protein KAX20_05580 [Candidatus Omnitrophica bacterium]|nr:hypothetical protein [Candidatus Omnitrophota bacterium]